MCAIISSLTPSICEYFEAIKMNLFSGKKSGIEFKRRNRIVGREERQRCQKKNCYNKSNDMPVDFDFWRRAGNEIQFPNVGTMRALGGSGSGSSSSSSSTSSSSGCYNTMLVSATAPLPALCQLILDFITFQAGSLLQDVRFSTQPCHETNNLSSSLKSSFLLHLYDFTRKKRSLGHNTVHTLKRGIYSEGSRLGS
jgi:hypothetical protein